MVMDFIWAMEMSNSYALTRTDGLNISGIKNAGAIKVSKLSPDHRTCLNRRPSCGINLKDSKGPIHRSICEDTDIVIVLGYPYRFSEVVLE